MKYVKFIGLIFIMYIFTISFLYGTSYDKIIINMKDKTEKAAKSSKEISKDFKIIFEKIRKHLMNMSKIQQEIIQAKNEGTLTNEKTKEYLEKMKMEANKIKEILMNNQDKLLYSIDKFYDNIYKAIKYSIIADGSSSQYIDKLEYNFKNISKKYNKLSKKYEEIRLKALDICKSKGEKDPECKEWYGRFKRLKNRMIAIKWKRDNLKRRIEIGERLQKLIKTTRSDLLTNMNILTNAIYNKIVSFYFYIKNITLATSLGEIKTYFVNFNEITKKLEQSLYEFNNVSDKTINIVEQIGQISPEEIGNTEVNSSYGIIQELEKSKLNE